MKCLICGKLIDDEGLSFCRKCRTKEWKTRFKAIQKREKSKMMFWKAKTINIKREENSELYNKNYWERRREQYG
jgi:hypothetical protein